MNATTPNSNLALGPSAVTPAKLLKVTLASTLIAVATLGANSAQREIAGFGGIPNDDQDDAMAIQKAMDTSTAGDTVHLPPGSYLIGHKLRPKSGLKIQGAGQEQTVLKFNASIETDFFDLSGSHNVELAGFTIEGNGSPMAHHGIFARTGSGHFIHDLAIQNLGSPNGPLAIHFIGSDGDYSNGVTDCAITDNRIRNIGVGSEWGGGIRLSWGSSRNLVLRNVIDNTGRGGIFANDGSSDLIISSNKVSRSGRKAEKLGIEVWRDCDRVVVEDNEVDHWLSIGGARYVAARRNTVAAPAGDIAFIGLELIGQDLVVTDNTVDGGQQIGVSVSNNASNQWQFCAYNTVRQMVQWGSQLQGDKAGAKMLYFYRNRFEATQRGNLAAIYPGADGRGFRFNGNCQQVTLDGNEICRNPAEGIELGGSGLDQLSFINNIIRENGFAAVSGNPGVELEWTNNIVVANGNNDQPTSRGFVHPKPVADFSCPARAGVGESVRFTNRSVALGGKIEHVLWDFGEGVPDTPFEGVHAYRRSGTFRVTLVVWDTHGRGALRERAVVIGPANPKR